MNESTLDFLNLWEKKYLNEREHLLKGKTIRYHWEVLLLRETKQLPVKWNF